MHNCCGLAQLSFYSVLDEGAGDENCSNCVDDYFITVDKRILKYRTNKIKIMNPVDVIKEWSNGRNG